MKKVLRKIYAIVMIVAVVCTSHGVMVFADGTKSIKDETIYKIDILSEENDNIDETNVADEESDNTDVIENSESKIEESNEDNENNENNKELEEIVEKETENTTTDETTISQEIETSETKFIVEIGTDETTLETEEHMSNVEKINDEEVEISTVPAVEKNVVDETDEDKEIILGGTESKKEFLASVYADYEAVFSINDDKTVITLEKDATLTNPINIKNNLTLDLNGHNLTGPENNYAVIVDNATFTFKDKKHKGILKGNAEYAVIKSNNATLNFISGVIKANDGFEAINFIDSNVLIIGSEIYGGKGLDGNKGSACIVGKITKNEYDFKAVRGLVLGGEGGLTGDEFTKGSGGKAIVLNGKTYERVIDNLPLNVGEIGDIGSADGGPAVFITGNITDEHIIIPSADVLIGGSGGKNKNAKNKKSSSENDEHLILGSSSKDDSDEMSVDDIVKLKNYTTPSKYITSLKDQGSTAWCGTFAHIAMAETYMLKNYWDYCQDHLYDGEFDLSEVATAYFYREHPTDPLGNAGSSREIDSCPYTLIGADEKTFVNYASKFNGIQSEADAVFPDDINNMHINGNSKSDKAIAIQNNSVAKLTNYRYAGYTDIYDYSRPNMIKNIKNSIAKNGSAVLGLTWHTEGNKKIDDTHATFAYAQPYEIMYGWQGGHAVQVIGWDDNYSKNNFAITDKYKAYKADEDNTIKKYMTNMKNYDMLWGIELPYDELYIETKELLDKLELQGDGAFLCKNSHGNFVWVSYYTSLRNCNVFDAEFVPADKYDNAYYYDGGSSPNEIEVYDAYVDYVAKKDNEIIKAVSIVATREMDKVKVTVKKELGENEPKVDMNGIEISGPYIERYVDLKIGNNFVELSDDQSLKISKGDKFTVAINAPDTLAGMLLPIDKNCESDDCNNIRYETTVSGNSYVNRTPARASYDYFDRTDSKYKKLDGDLRVHVITNDEANFRKVTLHCGHKYNTYDSKDVILYRKEGSVERFESPYTLKGNEFLCWEDQNGNQYGVDEDILINGDMDLTVKWKPLTYKLDLVDDGAKYVEGYVKPTTWTYGQVTVFPTEKEMYKKGFKFDGWREVWNDPDSVEFTKIGDKTWVVGDQEFYAKWVRVEGEEIEEESEKQTVTESEDNNDKENNYYKIEFRGGDGGNGSMSEQMVKKGTAAKVKPNEFTKEGHKFKHWIDLDGTVIQNEAEYTPAENTIFYAIWEAIPTTNPVSTQTPKPVVRRSSGGGGGGGGGVKINMDTHLEIAANGEALLGKEPNAVELQQAKVANAVSVNETKLNTKISNVPVNTNTKNSTWKSSSDGKWHLDVINEKGQVEQAKNTWACMNETKVVNGQNLEVQNFYFFDNNGDMLTGWLKDVEGKTYYLGTGNDNLGQMSRGWTNISDSWYFFNVDGSMLKNTFTPDGLIVGADGKWINSIK